ncbi:MAG: type II secretion system F family protein [Asticcacaulis sp.]|nr:type II secretion system F family protein [Asticcacaulis sp.]
MLIALIAFVGFILIASVGFVLTASSSSPQLAKRTQAIGTGAMTRAKRKSVAAKTPEERRKQITEQLKEAEKRERKKRLTLSTRMLQAGLVPNIKQFLIYSIAFGIVAAIVPFVLLKMPLPLKLLVTLGAGFAFGYGFPRWVLSFMAAGRLKKFTEEFPNAMDIIVRGIKSGLPVNDGLKIIAKESPAPLGPMFQRLVENVGVGMTLDNALERMSESIASPELRFFTIVIAIQSKTGGNLAEALGNLSTVLRARKMMREKIKALSSEAIASAGIIGSLPPAVGVMISLSRPEYLHPMFVRPMGQIMFLGGAVWMVLGILAMRKMINFKM